jgi:hypothetical protein
MSLSIYLPTYTSICLSVHPSTYHHWLVLLCTMELHLTALLFIRMPRQTGLRLGPYRVHVWRNSVTQLTVSPVLEETPRISPHVSEIASHLPTCISTFQLVTVQEVSPHKKSVYISCFSHPNFTYDYQSVSTAYQVIAPLLCWTYQCTSSWEDPVFCILWNTDPNTISGKILVNFDVFPSPSFCTIKQLYSHLSRQATSQFHLHNYRDGLFVSLLALSLDYFRRRWFGSCSQLGGSQGALNN